MPCWAAHTGATSGSSTTRAETNGRLSPMAAAWPISGISLERGLEVGGLIVLAAGGDDQLLLAVDDAEVAVVVDLADVAGVQPAVLVERLGGLLRVVEVALEDVAAPADHLAVVGQISTSHPGERPADGAGLDLEPARRSSGRSSRTCRRSRTAARRWPGTSVISCGRDRRGAGDGDLALVEAEQRADRGRTPRRRGTGRWRCSSSVAVPQVIVSPDGRSPPRPPRRTSRPSSGSAASAAVTPA